MKNLYAGDAQNLRRKIDEAALALQLEQRLTKDQILTNYLNTVYFGEGAYGIQAAAETVLRRSTRRTSTCPSPRCSPGLITAPNDFDPFVHPSPRAGRRDEVLRQMLEMGMITPAEHGQARRGADRASTASRTDRYPFPYFVDYFKQWFLSNPAFGKTYDDRYQLLFTGGLRITTTLDPTVQAAARTRCIRSCPTRATRIAAR